MQPITCDACRKPTVAHDVVNYGSIEGGYRLLCGRCFNEAAASRLGLHGFEHVVFEPVRMVDGRGTEHEDMPMVRQIGRDAAAGGYKFSALVLSIVKSDMFRMNQKAAVEAATHQASR